MFMLQMMLSTRLHRELVPKTVNYSYKVTLEIFLEARQPHPTTQHNKTCVSNNTTRPLTAAQKRSTQTPRQASSSSKLKLPKTIIKPKSQSPATTTLFMTTLGMLIGTWMIARIQPHGKWYASPSSEMGKATLCSTNRTCGLWLENIRGTSLA